MATAKEKVTKAKASLILEYPFIASIICNMEMIESRDVPTMAVNGDWVKYNPDFVEELSPDEVKFVLAHEGFHCVFAHMFRRGTRDHRKWNIAGDYIINDLLISEKVGMMPDGGLHNPQLVKAGNGTTEGVYDLLPESESGGGASSTYGGKNGDPLDTVCDQEGSQADVSQKEAEMKVKVAQAAQAAKMMGKMSAGLARFVDNCLRPKVDWRDVLRRFVATKAKVDATFARPKRRFLAEDIYLPSLSGDQLGEIVVAIDCSGSIGQEEIDQFASEIRAIKEDMHPSKLHCIYFDSEVSHHDIFETDDQLHVEPHGGGGTAFSPVFDFIDDKGIEPVAIVFLTDLCCNDFGQPPASPTLWVSTYADEAPFGEVVMMHDKR